MRLIYILVLLSLFAIGNGYSQDRVVSLSDGREVILHEDHTWSYKEDIQYDFDFSSLKDNEIPEFLRPGINVDYQTLRMAVEMHLQGWRYMMPRPKSTQAAWGNSDGRTTWWYGYWYNIKTNKYSQGTPVKKNSGVYLGDNQNQKGYWRNGGSPPYPSKFEWLLSESGGVRPR